MKILFLSHYGAMLGANRSLLSLVEGIQKKEGVAVMVWCPKHGAFTEALEEKKIPYEVHHYENWAASFMYPDFWKLPFGYLKNKLILKRLIKAVKELNPDIIHSNSSVLPIGAYVTQALQIPHVWHIREFGKEDYNLRFFPGRSHLYDWLSKAKKVILISKAIRDVVIEGRENISTSLIYNGVADLTHFDEKEEELLQLREYNTITFLIIGMLHPTKNQMVALKAFSKLAKEYPNTRLLIVGKGRRLYEEQLKKFTKNNNLENQVTFAGYLPNPKEAYQKSDVVLMCSAQEAMGRVTVEAMAYAKPVIGFNGGATPELITDGVDGFVYNTREELTSKMRHFLQCNQDISLMGKQGFQKAKNSFTKEAYIDNVYQVYKEII